MSELEEWSVDVYNRSRIGLYLASKELEYVKRVLSRNPFVRTILDVGCGSGKLSIPLYERGYTITGLDIDELPLSWFRRKNSAVAVVRGDALSLPFGDNACDCILAIELIDSIRNRERFYGEIFRVLKPGGLFIIQMSNKRSIKGLVYELYLKLSRRQRTKDDLENYVRDYKHQIFELDSFGFRTIDAQGYNWNLIPRNSDSKLIYAWKALEGVLSLEKLPALSPLVISTAIAVK